MFNKKLVDMIYVDVERSNVSNENKTIITYFDLRNGKTNRENISGGTFDNNGNSLAKTIIALAPVQVIFDVAGFGIAMKDSTLKALEEYKNIEVTEFGMVKRIEPKPTHEICDCGCGAMRKVR
jgi:hypothetical protein